MRKGKIQNSYSRACKVDGENEEVSRSQVIKSLVGNTKSLRLYPEATKKLSKDVSKEVKWLNFHFKNEFRC